MTMQERGKDEASGPSADDPRALSSDKAEELAADFTPAWDTGSDDDAPPVDDLTTKDAVSAKSLAHAHGTNGNGANGNGSTLPSSANATLIDLAPPVVEPTQAAPPIEPKPVILAKNQTLIGSAIAPATPPPPQAAAPVVQQPAPELSRELAAQIARESRAPAEPIAAPSRSMKPIAEAKDPFASPPSQNRTSKRPVSDADLGVPKKSGKGVLLVILGLGIAGGLGIFLKFALTDDTPKPKEPVQASSPPMTPTAEVPPPAPARDPDEPPAVTAKKADPPPPPVVKNDPPPPPVVRNDPPVGRPNTHHAAPQPPPVVKNDPPPAPKPPPPKPGGIVHENPF